jgi:hypothetical protein
VELYLHSCNTSSWRDSFTLYLFFHRVQTGSGTHPASYPMENRGSFPGGKTAGGGGVVKLITHLHLVPRPRMRGAIHSLPQYAFMACCSVKKKKAQGLLYFSKRQQPMLRSQSRGHRYGVHTTRSSPFHQMFNISLAPLSLKAVIAQSV